MKVAESVLKMLKMIARRTLFAVKVIVQRYGLRKTLRNCHEPIRVIIGSGGTTCPGWIATDYPVVDITNKKVLAVFFEKNSVHGFLAEHVWEHLTVEEALVAAQNCFELLENKGHLRIAVPDGYHCDGNYIEEVRPGGFGAGSDDHKVLYNYQSLSVLLKNVGFKVDLLEWFDEEGGFHHRGWSPNDGMVVRSTRYDERNKENPCAFTSLIIDAVKA